MKRVYHHYLKWEDYRNGMWDKVTRAVEDDLLIKAIEFTGDHIKYGLAMMRVIREWPVSCEHNLTDLSQNRKAWIGHAACSLEMRLPEYIVRMAWGRLSDYQRQMANMMADSAIMEWEKIYYEKRRGVKQLQIEY